MNFLKKLFSSKKAKETGQPDTDLPGVYSDEHFRKRYKEENINTNPAVMDGCMKMFKGFFIDNKIEQKVLQPINHPVNLDQLVNEGRGFHAYCKAFKLEDSMIVSFLSLGLSDFLINKYGFKLYKDSEPEFPLRAMTLKYDKNGTVLSLYPIEYALKVLNRESGFESLHTRVDSQLKNLPQVKDVLEKYIAQVKGDDK
jgi:hypothetical protein